MGTAARTALVVALFALPQGLAASACQPPRGVPEVPAPVVPEALAPVAARAERPTRLTVVLDGRPLHPAVATVRLFPGESMLLLDQSDPPAGVPRPRFMLRFATHGPPVEWQAMRGTVATIEHDGMSSQARYTAPADAGLDRLRIVPQDAPETTLAEIIVLTVLPYGTLHSDHLGGYRIGHYPPAPDLTTPYAQSPRLTVDGFIEVTEENRDTRLSRHVRLGDLECKQGGTRYPKYLALDVRLLDKLERLVDLLATRGIPGTALTVMSGYRTPYYNRQIGNRTPWSRHVMGDGADVFVDQDGDGRMDDLDGDGSVSLRDAQMLLALVDLLDENPDLVGGAAVYPATASHGPFVHLDTRGYRARW